MQISKEMQQQGKWLFRWRSYLPLLFIVILIPAFYGYRYPFSSHTIDLVWEVICLAVGLVGLAIRCMVIGYVPKQTSGRNTKEQIAEILNTKGMYSLLRNPLYLGNFFMWSAPILFFHTWWLIVIYILVFVLYYERIIITEEAFLHQKFGDQYSDWASKTPALFPRHFHWQKPELSFSWRTVIRREYHGLFGLIATMTAIELVSELSIHHAFVIDPLWLAIFLIGTVIYLSVRFLAKCTHFLQVKGR